MDLATYVPRSGATGERASSQLAGDGGESPTEEPPRADAVAKAPVGLPHAAAARAPAGRLGLVGLLSRGRSAGGGGAAVAPAPESAAGAGAAEGAVSRERLRLEGLRAAKWLAMLGEWPAWGGARAAPARRRRTRDRCRKGIPEALRGAGWAAILGAGALAEACGGSAAYQQLLALGLAAGGGGAEAARGGARPAPRSLDAPARARAQALAEELPPARLPVVSRSQPPLPSVLELFARLEGAAEGNATMEVRARGAG